MTIRIFSLLFILCVLSAVSVSAQLRSLANMPEGEKYVSVEGGFEVALPRDPLIQHNPSTGTTLTWMVKEGIIAINYWNRGLDAVALPRGTPRSELIEEFIEEYKDGLITTINAELGENKPSTIAGLPVTFFLTKIQGRSGVSSVYLEDRRSIIFLVIPLAEVPDSSDTLSDALETFRLTAKVK